MTTTPISFSFYKGNDLYEVWASVYPGDEAEMYYSGSPPTVEDLEVYLNGDRIHPEGKVLDDIEERAIEEYVFYT